MYINPFLAGVLVAVVTGETLFVVAILISIIKAKRRKQ